MTNFKSLVSIFIITIFISCGTDTQNETAVKDTVLNPQADSLSADTIITGSNSDSVVLKEASNEDDIVVNEYLVEQLKPIRENFKRINSLEKWSSSDTVELWESLEG